MMEGGQSKIGPNIIKKMDESIERESRYLYRRYI
jgi:hypothetical protein